MCSVQRVASTEPIYWTFVLACFAAAAGPKFLAALVENRPASTTAHTARAVSGSTAATFSAPLEVPSQPSATVCASAQKGCACVRNAYSPVMMGAHHRSVVVQPYGRNSVGVVKVSAYGWKKENMFVKKNPPFAVSCVRPAPVSVLNTGNSNVAYQGGEKERPRVAAELGRGVLEYHGRDKVAQQVCTAEPVEEC